MPLPPTVRVKLSSEAAGAISMTPVVVREMPTRDLMAYILAATGKQPGRVAEILLSGSLVTGASRLRWEGWTADPASIAETLATFPDPDPARPFEPARCSLVVLLGPYTRIELTVESASRRRLLRRSSFWDQLMDLTARAPRYIDYSYRDQADRYRLDLAGDAPARLRAAARLLTYTAVTRQIESSALDAVDFYVKR